MPTKMTLRLSDPPLPPMHVFPESPDDHLLFLDDSARDTTNDNCLNDNTTNISQFRFDLPQWWTKSRDRHTLPFKVIIPLSVGPSQWLSALTFFDWCSHRFGNPLSLLGPYQHTSLHCQPPLRSIHNPISGLTHPLAHGPSLSPVVQPLGTASSRYASR
jgi:hypothetical protein